MPVIESIEIVGDHRKAADATPFLPLVDQRPTRRLEMCHQGLMVPIKSIIVTRFCTSPPLERRSCPVYSSPIQTARPSFLPSSVRPAIKQTSVTTFLPRKPHTDRSPRQRRRKESEARRGEEQTIRAPFIIPREHDECLPRVSKSAWRASCWQPPFHHFTSLSAPE